MPLRVLLCTSSVLRSISKIMGELQEVFGHLFPGLDTEKMDTTSNPNKRPRPEAELQQPKPGKGKGKGKTGKGKGKQRSHGWASSWEAQNAEMDSTVYALARLCLKQEEELAEIRQEKMFMLHMTTSPYGILKPLVKASMEWNNLKDQGKVDHNLRTCLFRLMIQELIARLKKFKESQESISAGLKAGWISGDPPMWLYQRWCPVKACLIKDETSKGTTHEELVSTLEGMDAALRKDPTVLCQFRALRPLAEEMKGESVAFKVWVALRGQQALTLHQGFARLDGCAALQLIGANLHRERQRASREANTVRDYVYGKHSSGHVSKILLVTTPATLILQYLH